MFESHRRSLSVLSALAGAPPATAQHHQQFSYKCLIVGTLAALLIVSLSHQTIDQAAAPRVTYPGHPACGRVREIRICSHQIKGAASLELIPGARERHQQRTRRGSSSSASENNVIKKSAQLRSSSSSSSPSSSWPPPDGSLAAMDAMWEEGVTCFDVDVVLLEDGTLIASHPGRLTAAVNGVDPSTLTLDDARDAGADEVAFPVLEDLVRHFASLNGGSGGRSGSDGSGSGSGSGGGGGSRSDGGGGSRSGGGGGGVNSRGDADGERRGSAPETATDPVLGLDLKGPALTPSIAARLADLATSLGLEERILIYVWGTAAGDRGYDVLRLLTAQHPSVPVGLALRDFEAKHWDHARVLRPDALGGVRALVPSIKFDGEWYAAAAASGLLTFSWVVDDDEELLHALTSRVSACISNEPGRMINSLRAMYRGCMGT